MEDIDKHKQPLEKSNQTKNISIQHRDDTILVNIPTDINRDTDVDRAMAGDSTPTKPLYDSCSRRGRLPYRYSYGKNDIVQAILNKRTHDSTTHESAYKEPNINQSIEELFKILTQKILLLNTPFSTITDIYPRQHISISLAVNLPSHNIHQYMTCGFLLTNNAVSTTNVIDNNKVPEYYMT